MKNCLILINDKAGKCKKCSVEKVCGQIGNHNFTSMHLPCPYPIDLNKYDSLAVCGGDGTLQLIMQEIYRTDKTVYYFPCGTLNDKGKAEKYNHTQENPHQVTVGKIDDDLFTYVLAGGAFTEIGYTAQIQEKQIPAVHLGRFHRPDCRRRIVLPALPQPAHDRQGNRVHRRLRHLGRILHCC